MPAKTRACCISIVEVGHVHKHVLPTSPGVSYLLEDQIAHCMVTGRTHPGQVISERVCLVLRHFEHLTGAVN